MNFNKAVLLLVLLAACKKDDTTEASTKYTKHTIYYEATIETDADAEFDGIFHYVFTGDTVSVPAAYKTIVSLQSKHWVSDTMNFYDDGVKLYVVSSFAVIATAADSAILTLRTVIDGKEAAVAKDTGTTIEIHSDFKYDFN